MRVKSNKALRRSARLARRAPSPVVALPAAASFPRRPWLRIGAANSVAAAVAGILYGSGGVAYAQEQAGAGAAGAEALQEVVVTATAQAVKKLDASYSIVSASQADIAMANPASTAEIYKLSPGVWPEASGGQTGVNIDVAGFPLGGGDSPYFTTMVQGTPVYGSPNLSFMDNSSMFRMDDTVERVEIVQGGTSALFGPGQPGATANFILRTGSAKPTGSLGVTYGFEGNGGSLYRVDAFESGKLTEGWYGSIGGFYRKGDGVRDPQYPSDIGGQLTATLKHDLDNGSVMFWARTTHDKNQWVADLPYTVVNGSIHTYPGFDQLNSTWNSRQLQNVSIPDPGCNCLRNDDISDGRGADLSYFGSELKAAFGNGWSISNNFIFDGGYLNTHAMINNGNPTTLGAYVSGLTSASTWPTALIGAPIQAVYPNGLAADPNQGVILQQVWLVQKKLTSAIDEFRLNKELFSGNTLTLGVYAAHYTMNDNWSLGSNILTTNVPNAAPIILSATAGGNIYQVTSPQGITTNGGYNILQNGRATNVAAYLSDSWKIDRWLFDAGARLEHINLTQETSNYHKVQMGSQFDLWDNAVHLSDGTFSHGSRTNTRPTFSAGANYEFSDNMSAYVRVNNGVLLRIFDDVRCNVQDGKDGCPNVVPLQTVQNYEFGFKIQNQWTYIDASAYHKEFQGISYTPKDIGGSPIGPATTYASTSTGGRLVGSVNPFATSDNKPLAAFKITVNGIYENAHYKDHEGCVVYNDINNQPVCGAINGNQLARLPKYQYRITPDDTQVFSWGTLTEQLTYEYIGKRFQDESNLTPLPSYWDLGAGIDARVGESWEFRLLGSNLTNEIGLTEGNARFGGNTVQNNVGMGRSIVGREVNLTAKYVW
ncbi:MAG: TonB-dependent receptor [Gammaproteobacteria bacterium]|nr:MAG: TonB-dependent receptor [Gammaproteobacteria bacterium]TLZ51243.1 MAG: TonB-dependent receptor [Gammaproteobacteria bacterium]